MKECCNLAKENKIVNQFIFTIMQIKYNIYILARKLKRVHFPFPFQHIFLLISLRAGFRMCYFNQCYLFYANRQRCNENTIMKFDSLLLYVWGKLLYKSEGIEHKKEYVDSELVFNGIIFISSWL